MLSFILSLIYHTAFPMVYVVKDTPLTKFSYLLLLFCGNLQLLGNNVYFLTSWWAVTGGCWLLVIASIASRFLRLTLIFGDLNIQSISQFFSVRHKKKNLNRFPQHLLCVVFFPVNLNEILRDIVISYLFTSYLTWLRWAYCGVLNTFSQVV